MSTGKVIAIDRHRGWITVILNPAQPYPDIDDVAKFTSFNIYGGWIPGSGVINPDPPTPPNVNTLQVLGLDKPFEPECNCDMRSLMSGPHPAGCPWLQWKRTGSVP